MSQMEICVAADLYGTKQNIKFLFPTRPTLKEFCAQVETAFQKEAVRRGTGGVTAGFEVSSIQAYCAEADTWSDVARQGQLVDGMQCYAFQMRGRHSRSSIPHRSPSIGRSRSNRRTSSLSQRRSTSISDRQSHHSDARARLTKETQAVRTLCNDRRYTAFRMLAPEGRLDISTLRGTLLSAGALMDDAVHIEGAFAGMETGPDGCASFAQYSRLCRRKPKAAMLLQRCVGALGPVPEMFPPEPTARHSHREYTPSTPQAEVPAVLSTSQRQPSPGLISALPVAPPPPPAPVPARSWLDEELLRLDSEHQEKVRRVKAQFDRMQDYEVSVGGGGGGAGGPQVHPLGGGGQLSPTAESVENVYRQLADNLAVVDEARRM